MSSADHKREACILTGRVVTLEADAERSLVPSLADKVAAIEAQVAALHDSTAEATRAVPYELVVHVAAAEGKIRTVIAGFPQIK